VISRASDELPVVVRARRGGEKSIGRRASHHEECEALGSLLLPCAGTRVSLRAVWCLLGATPRGEPWTPTVTLLQGCNGLSAWRMAVLSPCREISLCRHVHRALLRSVWLDVPPILPATACHQRNYVERYSRANIWKSVSGTRDSRGHLAEKEASMVVPEPGAKSHPDPRPRGR